jgi:hypothetical protein
MRAMEPADSIGRLGFKRWYERQLIESHVYLVTAFLCAVLIATCLEGVDFRALGQKTLALLAICFVAGAIVMLTSRRFLAMLHEATRYAAKSDCPECGAYAKFDVLSGGDATLRVRCRKCSTEWTLP